MKASLNDVTFGYVFFIVKKILIFF